MSSVSLYEVIFLFGRHQQRRLSEVIMTRNYGYVNRADFASGQSGQHLHDLHVLYVACFLL